MIQSAFPELEPLKSNESRPSSILLVDDDEDQVFCLTKRLESLGFETNVALTGRHGVDLAHLERPDLIVLDLRLPDIDGLEVCSELADSPQTCGIPIIILSGMERPDIIRRSRAAGCSYYVRKPYDPSALLILIEQAIEEAESW